VDAGSPKSGAGSPRIDRRSPDRPEINADDRFGLDAGDGPALLLTHTPTPSPPPHALLLPPVPPAPFPAAPRRIHVIRGSGFVDLRVRGAPVRVVGSAWMSYKHGKKTKEHVSPCHHWRPMHGIRSGATSAGFPNGMDTKGNGNYFNCDDFWEEHWNEVGQMVEGAEGAVVLATHAPPFGIMDRRGGKSGEGKMRVGDPHLHSMLKDVSNRLCEPTPAPWAGRNASEPGSPPAVTANPSPSPNASVWRMRTASRHIASSEPLQDKPSRHHISPGKTSGSLISSEPTGGKPFNYLVSSDTPGADLPAEWSLAIRAPPPAPAGATRAPAATCRSYAAATPAVAASGSPATALPQSGAALATSAMPPARPCATPAHPGVDYTPPGLMLAPSSTLLAPPNASPLTAPGAALTPSTTAVAPPCTTLSLQIAQPTPAGTVLAPSAAALVTRVATPPAAPSTPATWDAGEFSSSDEAPRRPRLLLHVFGHVHARQVSAFLLYFYDASGSGFCCSAFCCRGFSCSGLGMPGCC
jgi:hypothetical protein